MLRNWSKLLLFTVLLLTLGSLFAACNRNRDAEQEAVSVGEALPASAMQIAADRELTPADIEAALKT